MRIGQAESFGREPAQRQPIASIGRMREFLTPSLPLAHQVPDLLCRGRAISSASVSPTRAATRLRRRLHESRSEQESFPGRPNRGSLARGPQQPRESPSCRPRKDSLTYLCFDWHVAPFRARVTNPRAHVVAVNEESGMDSNPGGIDIMDALAKYGDESFRTRSVRIGVVYTMTYDRATVAVYDFDARRPAAYPKAGSSLRRNRPATRASSFCEFSRRVACRTRQRTTSRGNKASRARRTTSHGAKLSTSG